MCSVENSNPGEGTDPTLLSSIGEISVYAIREKVLRTIEVPKRRKPINLPVVGELNEKDVKGKDITHATKYASNHPQKILQHDFELKTPAVTRFGPKQQEKERTWYDTEHIDTIEKPYAHFRFLYRSKRDYP